MCVRTKNNLCDYFNGGWGLYRQYILQNLIFNMAQKFISIKMNQITWSISYPNLGFPTNVRYISCHRLFIWKGSDVNQRSEERRVGKESRESEMLDRRIEEAV